MNSGIEYSKERVQRVIEKSNIRGNESFNCMNEFDLSLVNKRNIGEYKMKYLMCMEEKGFANSNHTFKQINSYNL